MEPTGQQLQELYLLGRELTAQLRCHITLIDLLPNQELCLVIRPRSNSQQRLIIYIDPNGERRYV